MFPQANLLALDWENLNLTQQEHAFANQKKCNAKEKNKNKKNKAGFSRLLQHPAWKRSGSILKRKDK